MINKLKTNPKFSSDIATSNRFMNRMAMITFFQTKTTISFQITFLQKSNNTFNNIIFRPNKKMQLLEL